MALDLCIDNVGLIVNVFDSSIRPALHALTARTRWPSAPDGELTDATKIRHLADTIPYQHAKALYLVDVCGCRYVQAAHEMGVDEAELCRLVADARTRIRQQL